LLAKLLHCAAFFDQGPTHPLLPPSHQTAATRTSTAPTCDPTTAKALCGG